MPDLWMDVDANVVVPMNIMPILDDTDFKSPEAALVYNSGGIAVYWHFVSAAGVMTDYIIHPTTGGVHDIAEPTADIGMYTIEIPASGGNHANNDTEGVGWITGVATGMLPWRGPTIGFRRAALNDLLIEGGSASTNLEDFFDGTGYAGGTAKLNTNVSTITNDAITAASINTGALTADAFAADAIVAATLATGALTADAFAANAIEAAAIKDGAITNAKVADDVDVNAKTITNGAIVAATFGAGAIDAAAIKDGAIDAATFAAGAIDAAAIANGAIDNATFAADVGSTAYATNIIALAVRKVLDELNLNHLLLDATAAADMTTEVSDNTIMSRVLGNGDTSTFVPSTDGLHAAGVDIDAILLDTGTTLDGRIPAALTANGNMKCSLVEILTTALTETAGYLAAGFKKFFNVATPTLTMDSTGTTLTTLATAVNQTTILDRIGAFTGTGVNTVLGFLRAMANKAAGVSTPSDLSSSGTFTNTTDSLEAVADNSSGTSAAVVADAVWDEVLSGHATTGSTGAMLTLAGAASGSGSVTWTHTVTVDSVLVDGAIVQYYSDSARTSIAGQATTNSVGVATLYLNAGNYYSRVIYNNAVIEEHTEAVS